MRKPGNVPGSYTIHYKIITETGRTIRVYKETYDPNGKLVHRKKKTMDKLKSATNNYLNFKINKEEYEKIINIKGILFSPKKQVLVSAKNVITAIQKLLSKEITIQELVDWVNIIWFSEAYSFIEEEANSIVSVLDQLECLDKENVFFTNEQYSQMISSLNSNTEFDHLYV